MKLCIVFVAIVAVAAAYIVPDADTKYASEDFLQKQKFFLDVLEHIHQPFQNPAYVHDIGDFVEGEEHYKDYDKLKLFFKNCKDNAFLPKKHVFSVFHPEHLQQAISVFNMFYYAKDWPTVYKNVLWARKNINEAMFVYALSVAVYHKEEFVGIVLPPIYEICPYMFYTSPIISEAASLKMMDPQEKKNIYYVYPKYTTDYYIMNEESKLTYLTEDIGWNAYYYYYHLSYPFWMGGEEFGLVKDRRGEQVLYMYQQFLSRYYLERLSNGLGEVKSVSYDKPIKTGYNPVMTYFNGLPFSVRQNYYHTYSYDDYYLNAVKDIERRLRDTLDYGFFTMPDGTKVDIKTQEGIEFFGNVFQANPDAEIEGFFGNWPLLVRQLVNTIWHTDDTQEKVMPNVLEHFETSLRDPLFYQLYNRLVDFYIKHKQHFPCYTTEDLSFPGVKIEEVHVGKLLTYFENFETDISNAFDTTVFSKAPTVEEYEHVHDFAVKAKQMRINHKPFTVSISIVSEKAQKAVVRIFMGPKYDEFGKFIPIADNYYNFVEIDQFLYELPVGKCTIKRDSTEMYFTAKDRTTYRELYKHVMLAIEGKTKYKLNLSEAICGFPDRLLLPKGHVDGMPMQFFVFVGPYNEPKVKQYSTYDHTVSCGFGSGSRFVDDLPLGYPLDRPLEVYEFTIPNMHFEDVFVYHKAPKETGDSVYYKF